VRNEYKILLENLKTRNRRH